MRIALDRDGKRTVVDVANDLAAVTVDGHRHPVRVLTRGALRVEVEIAGERVVVSGWPDHFPSPPGPVDVNGELWTVSAENLPTEPTAGVAAPRPSPPPSAPTALSPSAVDGVPVIPPMPGRVIEVRVREGDRVRKGDVLLVLEAMKMRNEIPSPVDATVRRVLVEPGTNARAKEPLVLLDVP